MTERELTMEVPTRIVLGILTSNQDDFATQDDAIAALEAWWRGVTGDPAPCSECGGSGEVIVPSVWEGDYLIQNATSHPCPSCAPKPCDECGGKRTIIVERSWGVFGVSCPSCGTGNEETT
jgi:hypothetical protein